ncbi:Regulator of telomere elongation helicase 1 [Nymphon striatum]|nr:Regulator of telomere elongation helicase 1 [Nymphon striatum]
MNITDIHGISVSFPFKPYKVQIDYMKQLIKCLQEGVNGILESPTGTGKTLCLLCASLAWLETKKAAFQAVRQGVGNTDSSQLFGSQLADKLGKAAGKNWDRVPKIIYCSRTHSQLSQAMSELKKTSYNHMKATIIASRDQLCIHPEVKKEENSTVKRQMSNDVSLVEKGQVCDIEDLVSFGNKHNCCPYFTARELKNNADIIFMPYNYLLDSKARKRHGIEMKNCVVIFDEAHNIASVCENSSSVQLKSQDLATAISEVTQIMQNLTSTENEDQFDGSPNSQVPDFTLNDLALLKVLLCEFEQNIDQSDASNSTLIKDGQFLYEILQKIHVTYVKKDTVVDLIDKVSMYLTATRASPFQRKESAILKFAELIRVAYSRSLPQKPGMMSYQDDHSQYFKVYLHPNTEKKPKKVTDAWTASSTNASGRGWILDFWCFNPGLSMEDLVHQEVRSIILTSGTLTPLDTFAQELGISFPVQLENPHVVESNQIWSGVVHSGPDRVTLNSTFKNRNSKEYLYSLGRSIMNISRIVPGGVLVFFPSYKVMEDSVQSWQANDVWNKLNDFKKVFVEPRSQVALNSCMALYYEAIDTQDSKGAIFFAVCRGKVSEGLDFANNYGRAVIITGLPFPPLVDQRVCLKKQYLDGQSKKSSHKSLTGDYWYKMEATRAVNQAIGRVIRHNKDYGAVIFCDERFDYASSRAFLPKWLSSKVRTYKDFGSVIRTLVPFYRNLKSLQIANPSENISQSLKNSSSRSTIETLDEQIGAGSCLNSPKKQHLVIADLKRSYESNNILSSYDNDKVSANSQKRKSLFESIYDDENKVLSSEFPNKDPIANDTALCKLQAKRKFRVVSNSTVKDSNFCITSDEPSSSKQNSSIQTSSSSVASTNKDNSTMPSQKMLCAKSYMIKMMEGKGYQGAKVTDTRVGWRCLKEFMGSQMRMKQVKSIINEDSSRFAAGKEVKSEINSENFKEFTKIIQKYRTSGEFNSLVSGLASIFTEKESLHELFLNFTMFVKPCHKDEFSKVCFNLTGNEARVSKTV